MNRLLLFIILFPTITTFISYYVGQKNEKNRNLINIFSTLINFIVILYLYKYIKTDTISYEISYVMGTGLNLKLTNFRYLFIFITGFIWFIVNIYSSQYLINYIHRNRYHFFFMITYVSTLGIFLSENILNLFTFFEIMSFASYPLIIHDEDEEAHEAGATYMAMAVAGGLLLLMGIFLMYSFTQALNISEISTILPTLGPVKYVISGLLIIGFGIKAGLVPLHIWLPKAHPAAPTPASAILSGVLVKTGIYGIIVTIIFLMDSDLYLSYLMFAAGFINIFTGGILALYPLNIKKTLAYSSVSQLGYLFLGIGLIGILKDHSYLAVYGTVFHIFNHAVFKVMLFMGMGIIYMITHELNINKLYGFGRFKPALKITFFIGLCAIIGLPGFNGYVSKTLIHHSLSEYLHSYNLGLRLFFEILFITGSSLTTAYLLKLYISLFVEDNSKYYASFRKHINKRALFPMIISSFLIIYIGINPNIFEKYFFNTFSIFNVNPDYIHSINFYTLSNVISAFVTIGLGVVIYRYYVMKNLRVEKNNHLDYINRSKDWISLEHNIYIPILGTFYTIIIFILKIIDNLLLSVGRFFSYSFAYIVSVDFDRYPNPLIFITSNFTNIYNKYKDKPRGPSTVNKLTDKLERRKKYNVTDKTKKSFNYQNKDIKINKKIEGFKSFKNTKKYTSIKKDLDSTKHKMNSITYSIYLIGIVIVVVLLALIIFST